MANEPQAQQAPQVAQAANRIFAELHAPAPPPGAAAVPMGAAFGMLPDNIRNFLIGLTKAEIDTATKYFAAHFGELFGGTAGPLPF